MDWSEALEIVIARTRHERFRVLCAGDHADHEVWRRKVIELAGGEPPPSLDLPAIFAEAKAGAAGIEPDPNRPGGCGGCPG